MKTTTKLRNLLKEDKLIVAPFILNALHAKIAEEVGFEAVYMTGCGTAAERGFSDVGLLTMTEMVANAKYIAQAVDIPVICDADTGYGNPINVRRTVREYEMAGVAGIHLEDQVFPKKCGFFEGKQVIPMEEHVQKIKAALDAYAEQLRAKTELQGQTSDIISQQIQSTRGMGVGADRLSPQELADLERNVSLIGASEGLSN